LADLGWTLAVAKAHQGNGIESPWYAILKISFFIPLFEYSPSRCTGVRIHVRRGNPDPERISTSYMERTNLTIRLFNRRFTRLTLGYSKKFEYLSSTS
jgi:hypothetical protein